MDRISKVLIRNVRAIESLDLPISPVTVLIGENGSGKSTIIEVLEILRKAAEPSFFEQFYNVHRGMAGLLRRGASSLTLGVEVEDSLGVDPPIAYQFTLQSNGAGVVVTREDLHVVAMGTQGLLGVIHRNQAGGVYFDQETCKLVELPLRLYGPDQLLLSSFGRIHPHAAIYRLLQALRGVEVQLPFDTTASWAARGMQQVQPMRGSISLMPAERLALRGSNLANAWHELRNRPSAHWNETMGLVRLGLGEGIDAITVTPDAAGGNVAVNLLRTDLVGPISAADLSDGQLAWLAFVAMARLQEKRTLLAVDEPELHLHPGLLGRVVTLLTSTRGEAPLVLSTHSDRVLGLVDDPAGAVRVCALDASGRATVSMLDRGELPRWLEKFGDLGQLRSSGYLPRLLVPIESAGDEVGA